MKFHFSQGKKDFPDGHFVKFKELEIELKREVRLTIRIYPSNTFVTYHNDYKNFSKVLYKNSHQVAQQYMGKWLDRIFSKMRIRIGGQEFDSIMQMYWKLVKEPLN